MDVLDILVGHCVAQGLQLLRWTPIVLQHYQQGLGTRVRSLSIATILGVAASVARVFTAVALVTLGK